METAFKAIEDYRISRGWTKKYMAYQLGINDSGYASYLRGRLSSMPHRVYAAAYKLGVPANRLLHDDRTPEQIAEDNAHINHIFDNKRAYERRWREKEKKANASN